MSPLLPNVDGVEHRYIEARGLRFHVAEAGAGEPVVLLHGWPQHWYEWREVIGPLAAHYRVICPDLRGFGWSEAPPGGAPSRAPSSTPSPFRSASRPGRGRRRRSTARSSCVSSPPSRAAATRT